MPDTDFYYNVYGGTHFDDIELYLKRASLIVECFVIVNVAEWQQRYFDLAVCAQAEYIGTCGGIQPFIDNVSGNVSSLTVGSFSITKSASQAGGSSGSSGGGLVPCLAALSFLDKGALLGRWIS